ncbi:hypothetical protein PUN28_000129 [Cardiocondyla obscurior]|uniref:Uncharacterized protein n=1 Tax=Cardiocondyla obscurior TaxID=286306 RepID=A0AAW2GXZ2_9HYME
MFALTLNYTSLLVLLARGRAHIPVKRISFADPFRREVDAGETSPASFSKIRFRHRILLPSSVLPSPRLSLQPRLLFSTPPSPFFLPRLPFFSTSRTSRTRSSLPTGGIDGGTRL